MRSMVIGFVMCLLGSAPALGAKTAPEPRIQAKVEVEAVRPMNAEERRAVYIAAGRVLRHVDLAREALAKESAKAARRQVEQALLLTDIIRQALPVYDVKAQISAGELRYQDEDRVQDSIVPIFEELNRAAVLAPVEAARAKHTAGAAVTDVDLVHTRAELDIDVARGHLDAAREALKRKDLDAADAALAAIQRSVRLMTVTIDLPLERARSNLMLARNRVDEGRLEDARAALRVTLDALAEYQRQSGKGREAEVSALRQEIAALEQVLQDDARGAREKLDAWWDVVSSWEE